MSKTNQLERNRFYTLLAMAHSVAKDLKEGTERIEYYLHLSLEWYREFNFDHSHQVKAIEVPMAAWKQIDFPVDMVDWVRVGFKHGNMIRIMTQDAYIPRTFDVTNGVPQENQSILPMKEINCEGASDASMWIWDGMGVAKYYGHNLNYNYLGYFDVDWGNRVINFKDTINGYEKVYLEYITDGIEAGAMTVVNPYAFRTGKDYVKWQRKENDDKYSLGEKDRAEKAYNNSVKRFTDRITHMDLDDVQEALRAGFTLVVQN